MSQESLGSNIAAVAFVQSTTLFGALELRLQSELISSASIRSFPIGSHIVKQGDAPSFLYVVFDGKVALRQREAEAETELGVLERGALFGEAAVLTQQPELASAVAVLDTVTICFADEAVRAAADADPKFGRRLAALMAARFKG